ELERAGNRAAQLRDFERVRQPCAKQVAFMIEEDLGLVDEAAKRRRMDDAVAVTLVVVARGRRRLAAPTSPRCRRVAGPNRKRHERSVQAAMTSRTSSSPAPRTTAVPGSSITTNLISP